MKNLITILVLIFSFTKGFGHEVKRLDVTGTPTGIDVHAIVRMDTNFSFMSSNYEVTGNVIVLNLCYLVGNFSVITEQENTLSIPLSQDPSFYTLLVFTNEYVELPEFCGGGLVNQLTTGSFNYPIENILVLSNSTFESASIAMFPNPTSGMVEISNKMNLDRIGIFDINGRQVINLIHVTDSKMDLTSLNDGIYLVELESNNKRYSSKIVVKK